MTVEPITATAPRAVGRTVLTQTWSRLTFMHWAVDPDRVAPHLPDGVRPDVLDGATYVGLIPFWMGDIGILGGPAMPYVGSFCETNVRLYSIDRGGRRGVVFVTLDASRLAPVLAARALGLPYVWSRMRYRRRGDRISYRCDRLPWPPAPPPPARDRSPAGAAPPPEVAPSARTASSRITVRVGTRIEPGPLEDFLTARWGLHATGAGGRTVYWPNEHERWPLHAAALEHFDDQLLAAAGFGDLAGRAPDSLLFSPGVAVRFGPMQQVA